MNAIPSPIDPVPNKPSGPAPAHHQSFWLWVMCLTGVDYFSTLAYQPSIAFENARLLAPLATVVLVVITLFGALPVYAFVAGRSHQGQGSIGMLEKLVHGWTGKTLVLVLLGFAATDFVITKTLSAADAAEHLLANPVWQLTDKGIEQERLVVTMVLLVLLGGMFLRGFREVIGLAVVIVAVYLVLNAVVIGSGLLFLYQHPERLEAWYAAVQAGPSQWGFDPGSKSLHGLGGAGWWGIGAVCLLLFPKLALGLSGFETGVAVMPLIRGRAGDDPQRPGGRIASARKLLLTAAVIMSLFLLGSSLVVSTLIKPDALLDTSEGAVESAKNRALAYIAHGQTGLALNPLFGEWFGTVYDLCTVVILWFAGASAMAGLLNLVPQYLPRYGMAPEWARAIRPLVILFTVVNFFVTWIFDASVEAQGGAYATGVLVLMSSAGVATVIECWRSRGVVRWLGTGFFGLVTLAFFYTTADVIIEKSEGIKIASCFIVTIIISSIVSRTVRATELRFQGFQFADEESRFLWTSIKDFEFEVLVPHRPGRRDLTEKENSIRKEHRLAPEVPIVFIEARLGDASDFYQSPLMEVKQEAGKIVLRITRCASIAHTVAALGLELSKVGKPPEIHFGWSDESPIVANLGFLLFGEGNIPWMVRELIAKAEPDPERQPRIIIG